MAIRARFFDGKTSRAHEVEVKISVSGLYLKDGENKVNRQWPWKTLRLLQRATPPLPVRLTSSKLPDAVLEIAPEDWPKIKKRLPDTASISGVPGDWSGVFSSALLAVMAIVLAVMFLPPLFEKSHVLVPQRVMANLGRTALTGAAGKGACVSPYGRKPLDKLSYELTRAGGSQEDFKIYVGDNKKLMNAYALPGGYIVIGRGLLEFAEEQNELAGVLAHEIGHLAYRHAEKTLMQEMGTSMAIRAAFGDVEGLSQAAAVSGFLAKAHYSREQETQADDFSIRTLEALDIDPRGVATLLERLEAEEEFPKLDGMLEYFSSHPATQKRRDAAQKAMRANHTYRNLLTDAQWRDLKDICDKTESWDKVLD